MTLEETMSPRNQHFRSWSEEITGTGDEDEDLDNPVKSNTVEVLQKEGARGHHQVLMFLGQTQRDQLGCQHSVESGSKKGWKHLIKRLLTT